MLKWNYHCHVIVHTTMQDERNRAAAVSLLAKENDMKRFAFYTLCFVFVFAFATAASAENPIRAHVPFDFAVGDAQFHAGDYQISQHGSMLYVVNADGAAKTVVASYRTERGAEVNGTLQFVAKNGKHYLAKVYAPGMQAGRELNVKN